MAGLLELVVGLSFIIVGLLLVFASLTSQREEVKGGGVILIGPIPIIFGGDVKALLVAVLLFALIFFAFVILFLHLGEVP